MVLVNQFQVDSIRSNAQRQFCYSCRKCDWCPLGRLDICCDDDNTIRNPEYEDIERMIELLEEDRKNHYPIMNEDENFKQYISEQRKEIDEEIDNSLSGFLGEENNATQ